MKIQTWIRIQIQIQNINANTDTYDDNILLWNVLHVVGSPQIGHPSVVVMSEIRTEKKILHCEQSRPTIFSQIGMIVKIQRPSRALISKVINSPLASKIPEDHIIQYIIQMWKFVKLFALKIIPHLSGFQNTFSSSYCCFLLFLFLLFTCPIVTGVVDVLCF